MFYYPNRAHKRETTEAGPPGWRPDKEPCPDMTPEERTELLRESVARDPSLPTSQRFAVRRTGTGLEFFTARMTREVDGDIEFHGYPTTHVPGLVLRRFRDEGQITPAEYRRQVKRLG